MFFTIVNQMDDDQSMEEIRHDLDKSRIAPPKNTWIPHQNTVCWCNLKLAQKKGVQFYQTRSHAIVLYNTLHAICIEKAVCMKTKEELFHKVYQSPRLPRVITETEFAKWTTASTCSRSKKILKPPKRIGRFRENPQRQRRL